LSDADRKVDQMSTVAGSVREFAYTRPTTVTEAIAAAADAGPDARYWAGGTDLMLEWTRRIRDIALCVDITGLDDLRGIHVGPDEIRIGSLTSLAQLERAGDLHSVLKVPAAIAKVFATPQCRTLATVGGNLCNASPAADLAPPLMALGGEALLEGPGGPRRIALESLFAGPKRTALTPDELLIAVVLPVEARSAAAYGRIARTVVDIALALVATGVTIDENGVVTTARVALGAVAPMPVRAAGAEALLTGERVADLDDAAIREAAEAAAADTRPIDDIRTTAAYRREVTRVLTERALRETIGCLREGHAK
jgi:CO/xanthine dehydrogenase FAD-binding subunit